jgi:hypothetical protein
MLAADVLGPTAVTLSSRTGATAPTLTITYAT